MNMKKMLCLILTGTVMVSLLAGCTKKPAETTEAPSTKAPTEAVTEAPGATETTESPGAAVQDETLNEIHEAVKAVFGADYIPSMPYDEEMLQSVFGVDPAWCEAYIAEGPMISAHVDTFIAIKAKPDKVEDVKKALDDYYKYLVNESFQYPSNIGKVEASKVVAYDEYVFFISLGMIPTNLEEQGDEAIFKKAEELNQSAIDAIEEVLGK